MGKKRDLQVLRTIDGETRTVGSSSPPDFLRYFDFPIFSYYYYITMFRCCCWNWFVGGRTTTGVETATTLELPSSRVLLPPRL